MIKMDKSEEPYDPIKAGAEILLKGGTMLNKACPTCKSPLYKYQGKILCVKCRKQYILVDDATNPEIAKKLASQQFPSEQSQSTSQSSIDIEQKAQQTGNVISVNLNPTISILTKKLENLTQNLENETDPEKIIELTKAIKEIGTAIRELSS